MNYLAIDIGGTSVKIAVFTSDLQILLSENTRTSKFNSSENLINFICNEINKFQKSHNIISVGIGIPGATNKDGQIINISNIPILENINIKNSISLKIDLPIITANDANAAALYQSRFGAGKDFENFIYVTLGTGIGGAIIIKREIFRGNNNSSGEIGFITINYEGEKKYLEDFIGRKSFLELANSRLQKTGEKTLDIKNISNLADSGDTIAVELMQYYGRILGAGLSSAMNLLDIPCLVIGGGVSSCTNIMYDALEKEIFVSALPNISNNFVLRKSKLLGETGLYGAATLAISQK